jgi:tRNA pseudouridine55 synthase
VQLAPRQVTIYDLSVTAFDSPILEVSISCSAGTYIRSLAHDLGQALGCGAVLSRLRRVASGDFRLDDAIPWARLVQSFHGAGWQQYLIPADRAVASMPAVIVDDNALRDILHGRAIRPQEEASGTCRALTQTGELVAILAAGSGDGLWYPHKVLFDTHDLDTITNT